MFSLLKIKDFLVIHISLCLILLLSACQSEIEAPIETPDLTITPGIISPSQGFVRETDFTFSANLSSRLGINYKVVLLLFSPNPENIWSWAEIDMESTNRYNFSVTTGLSEFSDAYQYKFGVIHIPSNTLVLETEAYAGPELIINTSDNDSPEFLRTYPENLSVGIEPTETFTFFFDEVIDPASVSLDDIVVANDANTVSSISVYQNRIVVTFESAFQQSTELRQNAAQYSITLLTVTDLNGNPSENVTIDFSVNSPEFQTFAIESVKYRGNCIGVKDIKKRFASPQSWNPVVEIEDCVDIDDDFSQRWFMEKIPGQSGSGHIVWASNYDYCLSKRAASDPVIERCSDSKSEQRFSLQAYNSYHLIHSDHGGCVAAGITDIGDKNKVESSLCTSGLSRNHWLFHEREMSKLTKAFMLGKTNVRFANIQYSNPLTGSSLSIEETRELVMYLYQTEALNADAIAAELNLIDGVNKGEGFTTANPYFPRNTNTDIPLPKPRSVIRDGVEIFNPENYSNTHEGYKITDNGMQYFQQEVVTQWYSDVTNGLSASNEVCAIKFESGSDTQYRIKTFASKDAALVEGWTITHQYKCGTCSTLKDLAVYMGVPDQTTPIRLCTKRGRANNSNLDQVKQCIMESVGYTEQCAESWAYNGIHTGQECQSTCLKTYGNDALFWPRAKAFFTMIIAEKFNACPAEVETDDPVLREQMKASGCPLANEVTGKLNDCLWCDEKTSGPGFKYAAARTRRGSGLKSAIPRPNDSLYYLADHTLYFK